MKIALCFIISYEHVLNKENIWREWIEPNKDVINVYFYYKDLRKIKSKWILQHTLPTNYIHETSYYHVIPAYLSILNYALNHDNQNKWFCMLTDSCCPIISPKKFRYLFYTHYRSSIFSWKPAWWNPYFHQRGNLAKLPKELWLANDPWFVLTRENVNQIIQFVNTQKNITQTISNGGLANETLFAVIFYFYKELKNNSKNTKNSRIICSSSHIADWDRRSSTTSPHIFKDAIEQDIEFIDKELERNKYSMFIRKVSPEFPDYILRHYIFEQIKNDNEIILEEPFEIKFNKYYYFTLNCGVFIIFVYFLYLMLL
jgi:hypothetical protein